MPTGYTSKIGDGQTFEEFAMDCARAFGALVTMRDSPGPIPERFEPSPFYKKSLDEAQAEYDRIRQLSEAEADEEATRIFEEALREHNEYVQGKKDLRVKYEAMLASVAAWTPPSGDHEGLKTMMREQLSRSISYDCSLEYTKPPVRQTGKEWHESQIEQLVKKVEDRRKSWADEVERASGRTEWVQQLRNSL